ncbi:Acyl-CoA dehydrogenase [Frankia canadensis]|uniref:Acyl-CoA dehydrogenase n=1 Tax=Frankia canadensis TaxID=1836972 RepID=A0A2I2KRN5_9ACTN|nr:acyl-CoA dehydrogenase family protein [Frankia canadensis]SNQ48309.1 Acyl-CoA dehydrogenase [Frankia canadensis]SOU55599.1 Acyl-CoA dehydrogenase [Frankia canadensis]
MSSPIPSPRALAARESVHAAQLARGAVDGLAARAVDADRDGELPAADLDDLRGAGLLGLLVPTRLGGSGGGFADWADAARVLATGSGATALALNMHTSVVGALARTPDDLARAIGAPQSYFAARDRTLAAAAAGAFIAVAMSERGAGSRLSELRTRYQPDGDGYRITGVKSFCSGASHADVFFVAARAEEPRTSVPPSAATISHFLVPRGPGVNVEPNWDSLGMRGTGSHDVRLDVRVPADALVGGMAGLSLLVAQVMPQWLVASYAAVYAGVGRAVFDAGIEHARGRTGTGLPRGLAGLPAVRARFGQADAALSALDAVVDECARRVDADPGSPSTNRWVWRAKLLAGRTAQDVAASIVEACGTSVTRRGHPLERLYRDARCGSLHPATSDVCADWLGLAALGGDPDADADVARW